MSFTDKLNNCSSSKYLGHTRYNFDINGIKCSLVEPENPTPTGRWVWKAEFFEAFPTFDKAMLDKGWWVAYMNVGNTFGCPDAMKKFDLFYREMTGNFNFNPKPVLEGFSRGGLYVYNWAAENTDKVGMIYADNPVCDFKSWPAGKGSGPGSEEDWQELLDCYHFSSEAEALAWPKNPIDNLEPLIKAGIPVVHICGDADELVPWNENTGVIKERIESLGGKITLFLKPGGMHHPHGPENPEEFAGWVIDHAL